MSEYFSKPYERFGENIKAEVIGLIMQQNLIE